MKYLPAIAIVLSAPFLLVAESAQGSDPTDRSATADALFRTAKEAMGKNDWATACAQFAESQRLDPAAGTLLNLADCEAHVGKLVAALEHFQSARGMLAAGDYRIPFAEEHVRALSKRVSKIVVRLPGGALKGVELVRDDVELGEASFGVPLPVDAGTHVLVVRAPGRTDVRIVLEVREGETRNVDAMLGETAVTGKRPAESETHSFRKPLAIGLGGFGLAALATGVVTGVMALDAANSYRQHCNNGVCDSTGLDAASTGKTTSIVSPVAFGVGAISIGATAYFWLVPASSPSSKEARITPSFGPSAAGLEFSKRF